VANAVHFVVHLELVGSTRHVTSVREVVDADGTMIISNEVFCPGFDGRAEPGYPMSDATLAALEAAGFDLAVMDNPRGWW